MIRKREMRNVAVLSALVLFVLLFCLPAKPAWSATYYVSTDGSGDYKTDGTDDHVEINQALLDINKKGGGTVHLKKGTYVIDNSIIIYGNTVLEGAGWSTVITVKDDHNWPRGRPLVTNKRGAQDITIRNLKIDGKRDKWKARTGSEGWGASYQTGINLARVSNVTVSGLWVGNNRNDQIHTFLAKNITIQDCTLEDGGHDCIYFYRSDTVKVINNRMHIRCNMGVRVYGTNHAVIRGNIFHAVLKPVSGKGGLGMDLQAHGGGHEMNDILIEGNVFFGTWGPGICMETDSPPAKPGLLRAVIRNNVVYQCHGGIRVSNFDALIENNTIFNNKGFGIGFPATGWRGGKIRTPDFPVTITARNNIIVKNMGYGLTTSGTGNARIISSCNNVWNNALGNYDDNVVVKRDISVDPLFVNASVPFADANPKQLEMDLHLKSRHGRWDGKKWVKDDVTSLCIDAGISSFAHAKEPDPNGERINLGGYGNTKEASKSVGIARGTISGKVTDKSTHTPVSGAKASIGGYFGTTDNDGKYTIPDVPVGKYSLTVSAIRYSDQVRDNVEVSKNSTTAVNYVLENEKVPPVVVNHSHVKESPVGKIISVTFSEPMNVRSAEKGFTVSPSADGSFVWRGNTMYFIPDSPLKYATEYKITIKGAEDLVGNKLRAPYVWEFSSFSRNRHLIGQWRFEEESGNNAKDSSGRDNHGVLKGNPTRVEGKIGKALRFDGRNDYVEIPYNDSLNICEEVTLEAWVKIDEKILHCAGIVGKFGGGYGGYILKVPYYPQKGLADFQYAKKKKEVVGVSVKHKPVFNSWMFLAVSRDIHGNIRTYVNGEQTNSVKTDHLTGRIADNRNPLWIGFYFHGEEYFKGVIDEVRIYNRALSPAEIKVDFGRTK